MLANLASVAILFGAARAATEHRIYQLNADFAPFGLTIKAGDTVEFVNDDPFEHNVYSPSGANRFDIGIQESGTSTVVPFDQEGRVLVRCRIHLKMRLTIVVEP